MIVSKFRWTLVFLMLVGLNTSAQKWSVEKSNDWSKTHAWASGCNYQPATAINQLEMFQAATFDPKTIDKELGWAEGLGLNTMRVFLHHVAWTSDKDGFKNRLNQYLQISSKHGIKTIIVFFDDCWNDSYAPGKQPEPKKGVHNSGWVRDPGSMIYSHPDSLPMLESYVKDMMTTFKNDKRILLWDLYNEPGNNGNVNKSLPLLKAVFSWARAVAPSQPVSSGVWNYSEAFNELNKFQLESSDVITYHHYGYIDAHLKKVKELKKYGRPVICTEYMSRRSGSLFQVIMPMLKQQGVGAINWGFVSGKTNTIFAWDTPIADGKEPELWFHDIFRQNGVPFSEDEVRVIREVTGKR
jgi:endo-1,4-beta-mannosidase